MIASRKEARIPRAAYPLCISLHQPSKRSPAPLRQTLRSQPRTTEDNTERASALPRSAPRTPWIWPPRFLYMRPAIRGSRAHACANLPPGAPPPHGLLPCHLDAPTPIEPPGAPIESPDGRRAIPCNTRHPMTARRHQTYTSAARWPSKGAPSRVRRRGET
ncbi:uncharacterized protein SCHCODRAFT_02091110 [Schizophyllum commune H4-8]|uniref:uncharacterized protein n=1 Tax=Schizophyllum commune (strain H4-8 / FGSC 9210) TaxID=578458 RepID=UPI00215E9C82|nr:uncharacterized protein SCHCODRAFT_02091110 [Schizophyllum commune H4-8]KAI5887214.1 hypothetical protein SCHCODRAFT_02091110 [Schizophyllum commune H4-8]